MDNYLSWLVKRVGGRNCIISYFLLAVSIAILLYLINRLFLGPALYALKDIGIFVLAVTISYAAVSALDIWRLQLQGKNDAVIARNYLKAALHLSNQIQFVRNGNIMPREQDMALRKYELENLVPRSHLSEHQKIKIAVYSRRWINVERAWIDFNEKMTDAEVSFGRKAVAVATPFTVLIEKLSSQLTTYLGSYATSTDLDILYNQGTFDMPDEFTKNLIVATEDIRMFVQKYI